MTLQEYNDNLRDLAQRTETRLSERVIVVAATRMLGTMQNRIFRDGKDSNGGKIGSYSTTPIYVTRDKFIQKSAYKAVGRGGVEKNIKARSTNLVTKKTSTTVIKSSGQDRKSMYLPDGYKEFREIQGRPTNEVNLFMKGDLRLSFTLQAKETEVLIGFNSELQSLKRRGLEEHFKLERGTIFHATKEEKEEYSREVVNELKTVHSEIMKGL
ncbi:hypothetical protein [Chitinophaga sp. YIM B06452]|uniref:hypothetical protein n=1 Tax=Chitinophaga sp. YIM B06452 TaxID=3082158 RepID=UPI0031FED52A